MLLNHVTLFQTYLLDSMSFLKRVWLCKGSQVGSVLSKGEESSPEFRSS
jgi:hypothetical protein